MNVQAQDIVDAFRSLCSPTRLSLAPSRLRRSAATLARTQVMRALDSARRAHASRIRRHAEAWLRNAGRARRLTDGATAADLAHCSPAKAGPQLRADRDGRTSSSSADAAPTRLRQGTIASSAVLDRQLDRRRHAASKSALSRISTSEALVFLPQRFERNLVLATRGTATIGGRPADRIDRADHHALAVAHVAADGNVGGPGGDGVARPSELIAVARRGDRVLSRAAMAFRGRCVRPPLRQQGFSATKAGAAPWREAPARRLRIRRCPVARRRGTGQRPCSSVRVIGISPLAHQSRSSSRSAPEL